MRPVGTFPGTTTTGAGRQGSVPGTHPGTGPGTAPGSNPGSPSFGAGIVGDRPAIVQQPRSSGMIYLLVAVLLAAISVLTYLLVASK